MTWFKVDDQLWSHPKFASLSDSAQALWLRAGSYSAAHLTDGFVPEQVARRQLAGTPRVIGELLAVQVGMSSAMWTRVDGGYQFHDWDEYQESSSDVKRRRDEARERMRNVRANKRQTSHNPSPSRPDLTIDDDKITSSGKSRAPQLARGSDVDNHVETGERFADLDRVAVVVHELTGRHIDRPTAGAIAEHYVARCATVVRMPTRYVVRSLRAEALPVLVNFLDSEKWSS